ncbi:MAG: hypothetical protein SRB1_02209 [Desulfobacteraceae bacterium Eth-SRB1]|nr:MAG: hypothetical protein SRB1_02209 [Desulfobacteraceae bacterium Eth-SRB1]
MDTSKDKLERRCPRLGGAVSFRYCMLNGDNSLPCWKIFDCWWETFDVSAYLKQNLSEDQFNTIVNSKPKPKITSLIDLIEQAKSRVVE